MLSSLLRNDSKRRRRADIENRASQRPDIRLETCAPLETRLWCEVFQHCVGTAGLDRLVAPRWSCGGLGLAKIADHDAFLKKRWAHKVGVFDVRNEHGGA